MSVKEYIEQARQAAKEVLDEAHKDSAMPFACRISLHRWSKWVSISRGTYANGQDFEVQRGFCLGCGKARLHEEKR